MHMGCADTCKKKSLNWSWLWNKNPLPHPTSAAYWSNTLPTELRLQSEFKKTLKNRKREKERKREKTSIQASMSNTTWSPHRDSEVVLYCTVLYCVVLPADQASWESLGWQRHACHLSGCGVAGPTHQREGQSRSGPLSSSWCSPVHRAPLAVQKAMPSIPDTTRFSRSPMTLGMFSQIAYIDWDHKIANNQAIPYFPPPPPL